MNSARTARKIVKGFAYRALTLTLGDSDGLVNLPVIRGPAKGLKLRLELVHRKEAYFWGTYDASILLQLADLVRPGFCVWDCGTYLGFYTCFFARAVGATGRVVAIEPDLRNLKRTMQNVSLNCLENVVPVNAAIGACSGEGDLVLSEDTNSHLASYYVGGLTAAAEWREKDRTLSHAKIPCMTLDQAFFELHLPPPDLIKIDIEGAEQDALDHALRISADLSPIIVLELHNPECDEAAWRFSLASGYRLCSLDTHRLIRSRDEVWGTLICFPPKADIPSQFE
jgi:FkbM family methyltransferase